MGLDNALADALMSRIRAHAAPGLAPGPAVGRDALLTLPYKEEGLSFAFNSFGVKIGVSLEDARLLDAFLDRLPPGWEPTAFSDLAQHYRIDIDDAFKRGPWYRLFDANGDSHGLGGPDHLPEAFESLLEDFIALHAEPWLFMHAGVVGWRGKAIVLPAESFAGKSTLTAALVAAGATYYSDEFAVLDRQGLVHPFPRRLSLRTMARDGWQMQRVEMTGGGASGRLPPLPIGLIALLSYDPDRAFRVETLDRAPAIMALCSHSVAIRRRPLDTLVVLQNIVGSARVIRGFRGEAVPTASWMLAAIKDELEAPWRPDDLDSGENGLTNTGERESPS